MTALLRRGACPTLAAPMLTGDGWLIRINFAAGLAGHQLRKLAHLAGRHGNGQIEVTARGNLQIRGLTDRSAAEFAEAVGDLDIFIQSGLPIDIGPLAGLDVMELADPRPLAAAIGARAAHLAARLGPKVSMTVDGGGALPLASIAADIKLEAFQDGPRASWLLHVNGGSRVLGGGDAGEITKAAIVLLESLAHMGKESRGRDLLESVLAPIRARLNPSIASPTVQIARPIGRFSTRTGEYARGYGLAFGQTTSDALAEFAAAVGSHEIRLAPERGLLVLGLSGDHEKSLTHVAARLGFVTQADDPCLAIVACAGAPACASAHLATKALAREIAGARPDLLSESFRLHLSGCSKRCAEPSGLHVTLVGDETGCRIDAAGVNPDHAFVDFLSARSAAHRRAATGPRA